MKPIHLCIPVLKRYDLLRELLVSLHASTVRPHSIHVIDNGRNPELLADAMRETPVGTQTDLFIPDMPMGLAVAWNWFIHHVPEERLICNDDSCIEKIGMFDESISPGYAYFEDCDYVERMIMAGVPITGVNCGVEHLGSQTLERNSPAEWTAHHEKFLIAQENFVKKWGRTPGVPGPHWPKVQA